MKRYKWIKKLETSVDKSICSETKTIALIPKASRWHGENHVLRVCERSGREGYIFWDLEGREHLILFKWCKTKEKLVQ